LALQPFRARARTVDHLGREQIADCPTAISELWKNAYDAYAKSVSLFIFGGSLPMAAVLDDGHGMDEQEFIEKWLMLGTESKASGAAVPMDDRNGLEERPRQGQKGIGRLSIAYLGPTVLLLSKRRNMDFVAALVDWRPFQNPHLQLDDVRVPVESFADKSEFRQVFARLMDGLVDNVWGSPSEPDREKRLKAAWDAFSQAEREAGKRPTAEGIEKVAMTAVVADEQLAEWAVWRGDAASGTALFVFDIGSELSVWVDAETNTEDSEEREQQQLLKMTLSGFIDPWASTRKQLHYQVVTISNNSRRVIVSSEEYFSKDWFDDFEHRIVGRFDEIGMFTGHIVAWGKDRGQVKIPPIRPLSNKPLAKVGAFDFRLGTMEMEPKNSTHTAEDITRFEERAKVYGGLCVYRDGVRVLPFGRPENDYFGIEERRAKHAGRNYFSARRLVGSIAITSKLNQNLRDKAGREGLIVNQAAREFKVLIVNLLKTIATRYFGSESDVRSTEIEHHQARYLREKDAEAKASKRRIGDLRDALRSNVASLDLTIVEAMNLVASIEKPGPSDSYDALAEKLDALSRAKASVVLPPRPRKMDEKLEERYRAYRDKFAALGANIERASQGLARIAQLRREQDAEHVARSTFARHQKFITDATSRWKKAIRTLLANEDARWSTKVSEDNSRYHALSAETLNRLEEGDLSLEAALSELDANRERLHSELVHDYESYIRGLSALAQGIDLDGALSWAGDERAELLSRIDQWQSLAQMGITVEIVGHELNETAAQVSRNLQRLPESARATDAYKLARDGFRSLVQRLEFLQPLRLSGPRLREDITGIQIERYLRDMFAPRLAERRIRFEVSDTFRNSSIVDYPHRILPVFANLLNNAAYWVTCIERERVIQIDRNGPTVYFSDSGPGIDVDDQPELFKLFFTRRIGGHGVGLYLSRLHLEQGKNKIRLANPSECRLPGANFAIDFSHLT
jgi:signal transduction histidine kinase